MRRVIAVLAIVVLAASALPARELGPTCGSCCDRESADADAQASPCCRVAPAAPRPPVRTVDTPVAAAPQAAAPAIFARRDTPPAVFHTPPTVSDRLVKRMRLIAIRI